jgi:starvation-inducible outer membrane lipoprotein
MKRDSKGRFSQEIDYKGNLCKAAMEDFARSFGTIVGDIHKYCTGSIDSTDFKYQKLSG